MTVCPLPLLPLLLLVLALRSAASPAPRRPHLVLMVADDLGWHDVSWHNRAVLMPHLHAMATAGVILNRSYVQPTCTPSRAALLTGLYAHRTGLQHGPLGDLQPVGLPTDLVLLPQRLRQAGYRTHLVGKWHLGFCKKAFTPPHRGFDSYYGFLTGFETYSSHESYLVTHPAVRGLDFRDQERPVFDQNGTYSTYSYAARVSALLAGHDRRRPLFLYYAFQSVHVPLEVPRRFADLYPGVADRRRRLYLGMASAMDEAVGRLVADLRRARMLDDTLFVFTSDNGGKRPYAGASNWPLRGFKDSLWEGGVRVPGFVYGRRLARAGLGGRVENGYVHISDWAPTLLELAGRDVTKLKLDGVSHARTILRGRPSARSGLVVNIDEVSGTGAVIEGRYKLIMRSPEYCRSWYHPPHNRLCKARVRRLSRTPSRLYDIHADPTETRNLAAARPAVVARLLRRLDAHVREIRPSLEKPNDPRGLPSRWGGVWSPGWC